MQEIKKSDVMNKEDFCRKWMQLIPPAMQNDFMKDFKNVFSILISKHVWEYDYNDDLG